MNRRELLKQVAATAVVGAVAPQVLAEPVKTGWLCFEPGEAMFFLTDPEGVDTSTLLDTVNAVLMAHDKGLWYVVSKWVREWAPLGEPPLLKIND